jgi:GNAT superfamily N-acetyltransferase
MRAAGVGDADAIQAVMVAATIHSIWPTLAASARDPLIASYRREILRQQLRDAHHHFWVALDSQGGDICGVVALSGTRELRYLFVRPRWQRHGIGRGLWQLAHEYGRQAQGGQEVFTVRASLNAVAACERLGFEALGPVREELGCRWQTMQAAA